MKKYELTEGTVVCERTLHRIRALRDFADVKKGELGGWVEKEGNLAQDGNAWISDDACVYGNAYVHDNARVCGNAWVGDRARIYGEACICGSANVYGDACVGDRARIYGNACIYGDSWVFDNAKIYGDARVFDNAKIHGDARIYGKARVCSDAEVSGDTWEKSPLIILGTKWTFNLVSKTHVRVGESQIHTWEEWRDKYRDIASANGVDEDVIAEYIQYFNLACKLYGHEDCIIKTEQEPSETHKSTAKLKFFETRGFSAM